MKKILIVICERDGWTWRIEPQEGCDSGVDLIYQDDGREPKRFCLGGVEDAKALAEAIAAYVDFAEKHPVTE